MQLNEQGLRDTIASLRDMLWRTSRHFQRTASELEALQSKLNDLRKIKTTCEFMIQHFEQELVKLEDQGDK